MFPTWCVYMVLTDSRSGSYNVTDDVTLIIIVANSGLNISKTRPDSEMVTADSLYKLAYGLSIARSPDDVT